MNENKIDFWGTLDVLARSAEEIPPKFQVLWDSGNYRMRKEDIGRLKKYLSRLSTAQTKIKTTLKMFEPLA